ncbi:MAG: insulinase family protein [Myxococcales bacterium]|nr:insulinase family protein [Myxococcales bacterium]
MTRTRLLPVALAALALAGCKTQGAGSAPPPPPPPAPEATPPPPAPPPAPEGPTVALPFEQYTLKNGLTVILHQDRRLPLVAVSVWYDVGGLHEREGRSGFAHLFEHMMFQGSEHVGEDQHFRILEQIGGTQMNGTTDFDRTNYFETVPANELETALWLESDRMGWLLPSMTDDSLKNQIDVVQNERRQSVVNQPYGLMNEQITHILYPKPHPYYGDVIGSMEDIAAASLDDVKDFFLTYYTPANATLVLAGDFDVDAAKALVEKYFGPITGRPKPAPVKIPAPALKEPVRITFPEKVGKLAKVHIAWMGPSAFEKDSAALDLLTHVISGTRSSRLDKRVTHDDLIAQSVTAYYQEYRSGGHIHIDLTVRPGRTPAEAETAIDQVLADLTANPPTAEELKRALNNHETRLLQGLERLGGFSGRAERLQLYHHYLGDPDKLAWDLARYRAVTVEDLARVLNTYLGANRLVVHALPEADEGGAK